MGKKAEFENFDPQKGIFEGYIGWGLLQQQPLGTNRVNIIRNIYMDDRACIKSDNQCTELFDIGKGVRQGCVSSPLLFNIFMADFF